MSTPYGSWAALKQHAVEALPQIAAVYTKVTATKRHFVVDALLVIDSSGDYAIPVLKQSLGAIDTLDRKEALLGLMRFRSNVDAILPSLTSAIKDASPENRLLAVGIIRGLGEKAAAALPALIPLTAADQDSKMRSAAVGAIGSIKPPSPDVVPVLEQTLKDADVRVRLSSVYALRRMATLYPDQVGQVLKAGLERETQAKCEGSSQRSLARSDSAGSRAPAHKARHD